jgi:hypothetical protein
MQLGFSLEFVHAAEDPFSWGMTKAAGLLVSRESS